LTIDDLEYLETIYTEEFRNRTLATLGSYRVGGASYGIESASDPIDATDSSAPFFVEQNQNDPMRIDVYPGDSLSQSGMRVRLASAALSVELARTTVGSQNVVTIEYVVVDDTDTITRTRYNTSEARRTRVADETNPDPLVQTVLSVVSLTDWQSDTLYPPDRRANTVPIAYCTVVAADNQAGQEVAVDLSRVALPANRPWFSPVDIQHRTWVGTGSTDTPHQLGLNDLSQGTLSLYDQLVNHGIIVGRDRDAPGVPGSLCFETLTPARLETDQTGQVTGTLSQQFIRLVRFPVRLLGCYSLPDPVNELAVELMPHSNILLFHQDDTIPASGARLLYSTVDAAEPLTDSLVNDELLVRQPDTDSELVVAGGRAHQEILPKTIDQFSNSRATISLGAAPAIPKRYRVVIDQDGRLLQTPQHLVCAVRLDDLGTGLFTFESAMLGAARIRVGLQNVNLNASTSVTLRITGTDNTGNSVSEDLTFDFSNYTVPVVGQCVETATNFRVTGTVFTTAQTLAVVNRVADGPATAVCVYADLDPMSSDGIRDACPVADLMWDGARICRIQDVRRISTRLELPSRTTPVELAGQAVLAGLAALSSTGTEELLADDLRDPHWFRLSDPLRYWKFHDGLRSDSLPAGPLVESSGQGTEQDRYLSRAVRLRPGSGRSVLVWLFGHDARRYLLNGIDGLMPNLEYRWSATGSPTSWIDWAVAPQVSDANGAAFRIPIADDTAFKFQLRLKGSVVGIVAIQYIGIGGSQRLSGSRAYTAAVNTGETHQVSLPFGQSFGSSVYRINVNAYASGDVLGAGDPGLEVTHVERFVDHAVAHLTRTASVGSTAWTVEWSVDLAGYVAANDGGFGDTVV
jgi:hypothetical protein